MIEVIGNKNWRKKVYLQQKGRVVCKKSIQKFPAKAAKNTCACVSLSAVANFANTAASVLIENLFTQLNTKCSLLRHRGRFNSFYELVIRMNTY